MKTVLNEKKIKKIISLLGIKEPEYNEIHLTKSEIESLYKLSHESDKNCNNITIRTSNKSGIGTTVKVLIDSKETDITDIDSW